MYPGVPFGKLPEFKNALGVSCENPSKLPEVDCFSRNAQEVASRNPTGVSTGNSSRSSFWEVRTLP